MKKLLFVFLFMACQTEDPKPSVLVEVYKVKDRFYHSDYYIFAVPPQISLEDSILVDKRGKWNVGDRFYK